MTRASMANYSANPQLIPMMNGIAQGFKGVGDALVSLGDDKVKAAKEEALKTELKAKEAALARATAAKNVALNPEAVKKVQQSYGIEEGSPLASLSAPTQANADLGLVDLGKEDKPLKPDYSHIKTVGNTVFDARTNQPLYTAPKDKSETTYGDKYVEFFTGEDGNRIGVKGNSQKVNLGKVKDYNVAASKNPNGLVPATGVGDKGFKWLQENGLVSYHGDFNGQNAAMVSPEMYKKAKSISLGEMNFERE